MQSLLRLQEGVSLCDVGNLCGKNHIYRFILGIRALSRTTTHRSGDTAPPNLDELAGCNKTEQAIAVAGALMGVSVVYASHQRGLGHSPGRRLVDAYGSTQLAEEGETGGSSAAGSASRRPVWHPTAARRIPTSSDTIMRQSAELVHHMIYSCMVTGVLSHDERQAGSSGASGSSVYSPHVLHPVQRTRSIIPSPPDLLRLPFVHGARHRQQTQ